MSSIDKRPQTNIRPNKRPQTDILIYTLPDHLKPLFEQINAY
jgi:hypothetical protein